MIVWRKAALKSSKEPIRYIVIISGIDVSFLIFFLAMFLACIGKNKGRVRTHETKSARKSEASFRQKSHFS